MPSVAPCVGNHEVGGLGLGESFGSLCFFLGGGGDDDPYPEGVSTGCARDSHKLDSRSISQNQGCTAELFAREQKMKAWALPSRLLPLIRGFRRLYIREGERDL